MVYVRSEGGSSSVWLQDLETGDNRRLSSGHWRADAPDIQGDGVVWQESRQSGSAIVFHDLEASKTTVLTSGHRDCFPSIWGDNVVWTRESAFGARLMYLNVRTGVESAVRTVQTGTTASLHESLVVHDHGGDLYLIDLRSAEETVLIDSEQRSEFPDMDGDTVVYASWSGSLSEIHAVSIASRMSTVLVSDVHCAYAPSVDGSTVAWESYSSPAGSEVRLATITSEALLTSDGSGGIGARLTGLLGTLGRWASHMRLLQLATIASLVG